MGNPFWKKSYKCNLCDFASVTSRVLRNYKKTHTGKKSHNAANETLHLFVQAFKDTSHKCKEYEFASVQASNLRTHLKINSGKNCNQCDFASVWAGDLKTHFKTHIGEKSDKCNQCNFTSILAVSLRRHYKTRSREKSHTCNQCNFAFKGTFENPLWKITLGENRINVANATLHMFIPAVWGRIWKLIQDKRLEEP